MKKQQKIIIYSSIFVGFSVFLAISIILNWNPTTYSWTNDPNRQNFPESVSNITLIVDYGAHNGTSDTFEGINLTDHYTTVFDLLNKCCIIEYRIYYQNVATFYVASINYLSETASDGWRYTINGEFALGCNTVSPPNNSLVRWYYTS